MSEPSHLRLYRANQNLPRLRCGQVIEIDDSDGRWADWIDAGIISPIGPPAEPYVPQAPWEDPDESAVTVGDVFPPNPHIGDLPAGVAE